MRNYLTFDNKDSRDFGVYINGQGTFRAPARSYNVLNIPGRNGDLLGFGSKLENVEITYRAFIYTNFDANIAALRSFLLSHVGYFKLTDSYHPDEYRLAYYKGPFVPDVVANNGAGSFDLTFVCKPQRFLNSGEEVTTLTPAGAEQHTYQGEIVNFSTLAGDKITSALADFHPIQDLHGYDRPWPAGGGKNLLNPATMAPGYLEANGNVHAQGVAKEYYSTEYYEVGSQAAISVGYNAFTASEAKWIAINWYDANKTNLSRANKNESISTFTPRSDAVYFRVSMRTYAHGVENCYCALGDDITFSPYSNICPISGRTGVDVWDDPKYGGTIEWNQLVDELDSTTTWNGIDITNNGDGSLTLDGGYTGTSTGNLYLTPGTSTLSVISGHKYYINLHNANVPQAPIRISSSVAFGTLRSGATISSPASSVTGRLNYRIAVGGTLDNVKVYPQVFDLTQMFGEEVADYIYSLEAGNYGDGVNYVLNLFPKDYYPFNAGEQTCVSAVNGDPYWKKTVDWTTPAGTVYGGTLDVVTGVLTVDRAMVDLGTLGWSKHSRNIFYTYDLTAKPVSASSVVSNLICSEYKTLSGDAVYSRNDGISMWSTSGNVAIYDSNKTGLTNAQFKTAMSGVQLCYELATPLTYQLTPQEIEALADNYIWSDVGQVTVTVTDAMTIENPTLFDAKPLLRVYGAGTLTLGGQTITISTADVYTDIDCELMDCFKDTVSKNGNVSFSGYDFPVIPPGRNVITMDGVTQVDITPRWWAS